MSIRWMATVWSHAVDVKGTKLLVLLSLADHSQDDGTSFPSVARIAARARTTERNVQYALTELEQKGWLIRHPRHGRSTLYQLAIPDAARGRVDEDGFGVQSLQGASSFTNLVKPTAPITIREPTTSLVEGSVKEPVSEETAPPAHPVTEQPFPAWARARLGSVTEQQAGEWVTAWRSVTETAQEWDPGQNLTKYLARCKERKKKPSPDEWVRWFAEDDLKAQREARAVAASTNQETPPQWWE